MVKKQSKVLGPEQAIVDYFYNSENQLIKIKFYASSTLEKEVHYLYGATGKRIEKILIHHVNPNQSFTRRFVYDGDEILYELDENNTLLASYTHSGLKTDDVLAINVTADGITKKIAQTAGTYFYLKDAQGTTSDIVDSSGQTIQHYIFSAFGKLLKIVDKDDLEVTIAPPIKQRYTYTGREYDSESGLYYYRARYYSADIGRFLQSDPHPGLLINPITLINKYVYAGNNPINYTDPTGASFFSDLLAGIFAIVAVTLAGPIIATISKAVVTFTGVGAFWGGVLGSVAGAVPGAVIGGLAGGVGSVIGGGKFSDGVKIGAFIGAMKGARIGYEAGYDQGYGNDLIDSGDRTAAVRASDVGPRRVPPPPEPACISAGTCKWDWSIKWRWPRPILRIFIVPIKKNPPLHYDPNEFIPLA